MASITHFEEIEAWKTARELTIMIYRFTEKRVFTRDFGLKDQMRRTSVTVMSNIAEGFESKTQTQFVRYLGKARTFAGEVRSQLYIAADVHYMTREQFNLAFHHANKVIRQINLFIATLESHPKSRHMTKGQVHYDVTD